MIVDCTLNGVIIKSNDIHNNIPSQNKSIGELIQNSNNDDDDNSYKDDLLEESTIENPFSLYFVLFQ